MKDSLFEMLLSLFEKTLARLKENYSSAEENSNESGELATKLAIIKKPRLESIRIFNEEEQMKLSKPSYQLLMRLITWKIVTPEMLELILTKLLFSGTQYVSLQETKWTIRNTLADFLDNNQLAFLDLVLYHKEDELSLH